MITSNPNNDSKETQDLDDADLESINGGVREGGCIRVPDLTKVPNPFGVRETV